jgi:hypothetical protein
MVPRALEDPRHGSAGASRSGLLLSVVVPVYNQAGSIVENVRVIRERVAAALDEPFELIVVSDGSVDETEERLLEAKDGLLRTIHYDRNLGKGYAVKAGALAAKGRWIAFVDADLDLDPASIPVFLAHARERSLDFAIGSKRHPDSIVQYPRSRRVASWLYQQAVRLLFRLNVRDTQVGLKVFRREVADDVLPLLLVKRYAFDLELLAVSRSLGYGRMEELPVRLDYRFTGSGVRSLAVLRALVDTAAIFYRLRILRYYERKRGLLAAGGSPRDAAFAPLVSLVGGDDQLLRRLDYERVELVPGSADGPAGRLEAARRAGGDVLAFLGDGAIPAGNWLSAAVPFLRAAGTAAVVVPTVAPAGGSVRERAAAAVWESRLGGGSGSIRFTPGNLRLVRDFPAATVVVKRDDFLAAATPGLAAERLCEELAARGRQVVYTPETVVVARRSTLFREHLREVGRYARGRAGSVRRRGVAALRLSTLVPLVLVPLVALAIAGVALGGDLRVAGIAVLAAYAAAVLGSATIGAMRFRSPAVGALAALALPLVHVTYAAEFARGLLSR